MMFGKPTSLAAGSLALLLAAPFSAVAQDQALRDVTVVLANPSAINVTPVWAAIGGGYFEEEGLNIRIEAVNGSAAVLQAVTAGQADIGQPGAGPCLRPVPEAWTSSSSTISIPAALSA